MKHCLNLLPATLQRRILRHERLRQWAFVWVGSVIAFIAFYGGELRWLSECRADLQAWQHRATTAQSIESKNREIRRTIAELEGRLAKYGHLENEELGSQLLATVSHSANLCGDTIQVQKLSFKQSQLPERSSGINDPTAAGNPPKMRDVRTLSLAGVASNNLAVAKFVSSLRDTAAFESVDLKSTQGKRHIASGPRSFHVECSF